MRDWQGRTPPFDHLPGLGWVPWLDIRLGRWTFIIAFLGYT